MDLIRGGCASARAGDKGSAQWCSRTASWRYSTRGATRCWPPPTGYLVVAPDSRGHGLSDQPREEEVLYDDLLDDLLGILDLQWGHFSI
jgi:pimeloyl-ACP methyl ester carboxylesterase